MYHRLHSGQVAVLYLRTLVILLLLNAAVNSRRSQANCTVCRIRIHFLIREDCRVSQRDQAWIGHRSLRGLSNTDKDQEEDLFFGNNPCILQSVELKVDVHLHM